MPTQFENVFGGSMVGNFLTAICFGVLTVQMYGYYHTFRNDRTWPKVVVAFLWTLEGLQLGCVSQAMYWWMVTNHFNPAALANATWEFAFYQISSVAASVTVQTFFAHRVYSLSENIYLGFFVEALVLVQFGFGAATAINANITLDFEKVATKDRWLVVTWLGTQAFADVVIATFMSLLLARRRTGFKKTDTAINRMIIYTINTGVMTCLISVLVLIMFAVEGFHFIVLLFGLPLGGFYSITMLANLHTRTRIRQHLSAQTSIGNMSFPLSKISATSGGKTSGASSAAGLLRRDAKSTVQTAMVVDIRKETFEDSMDKGAYPFNENASAQNHSRSELLELAPVDSAQPWPSSSKK